MTMWDSLLLGIKLIQLMPNLLGGAILASDAIHGQARRDMVHRFGDPACECCQPGSLE